MRENERENESSRANEGFITQFTMKQKSTVTRVVSHRHGIFFTKAVSPFFI